MYKDMKDTSNLVAMVTVTSGEINTIKLKEVVNNRIESNKEGDQEKINKNVLSAISRLSMRK